MKTIFLGLLLCNILKINVFSMKLPVEEQYWQNDSLQQIIIYGYDSSLNVTSYCFYDEVAILEACRNWKYKDGRVDKLIYSDSSENVYKIIYYQYLGDSVVVLSTYNDDTLLTERTTQHFSNGLKTKELIELFNTNASLACPIIRYNYDERKRIVKRYYEDDDSTLCADSITYNYDDPNLKTTITDYHANEIVQVTIRTITNDSLKQCDSVYSPQSTNDILKNTWVIIVHFQDFNTNDIKSSGKKLVFKTHSDDKYKLDGLFNIKGQLISNFSTTTGICIFKTKKYLTVKSNVRKSLSK